MVLFDSLGITLADDTPVSSLHWLNFYLHRRPTAELEAAPSPLILLEKMCLSYQSGPGAGNLRDFHITPGISAKAFPPSGQSAFLYIPTGMGKGVSGKETPTAPILMHRLVTKNLLITGGAKP